jgi:hypothetical protein
VKMPTSDARFYPSVVARTLSYQSADDANQLV